MTDSSYAHVVILADRSGSMAFPSEPGVSFSPTRAELATTGVRQLIDSQRAAPGKTTFSLVQFCTGSTERVAWFAPGDNSALRRWACKPFGGTPLLDATGDTIISTGSALAALPEDQRPGRVYFAISTDGEENSSREYTLDGVKAMITSQREQWKWEFLFLGAGFDAFAEAGRLGIPQASSLAVDFAEMDVAYASTGDAITRSRASGQSVMYSDDERKRSGGAGK